MDDVWRLTQDPASHQRWDLRFTRIQYRPRPDPEQPQHFLYETRIGFGLSIKGTGESLGMRSTTGGDTTSALRFSSADAKSLIHEGSGYWRYVSTQNGIHFFTWYDYAVRFGWLGRLVDRWLFRRLMGWATAWSFDRLRLWAEEGQSPESSMSLSLVHAVARLTIAIIWIWHGLVPKLIFRDLDEQIMLKNAGVAMRFLPWIGFAEIAIGITILLAWRWRSMFILNGLAMLFATVSVAVQSPST